MKAVIMNSLRSLRDAVISAYVHIDEKLSELKM